MPYQLARRETTALPGDRPDVASYKHALTCPLGRGDAPCAQGGSPVYTAALNRAARPGGGERVPPPTR